LHRCLWPQTVQTRCKSRIIAEFSDASCLGSTPRASSRAETLSAHRRQALGAQRLHVLLCERGGAGDRPYTFKSLPSSESCSDAGFTRVSQLLVFPTALQRPLCANRILSWDLVGLASPPRSRPSTSFLWPRLGGSLRGGLLGILPEWEIGTQTAKDIVDPSPGLGDCSEQSIAARGLHRGGRMHCPFTAAKLGVVDALPYDFFG
jgi:hypothetical protein